MKILIHIILSTILLLSLYACDDSCSENRTAIPLAEFYVIDNGVAGQVTVDSMQVSGIGAPHDSIWSEPSETKSQLSLPFKIDSDTTQYLFSITMRGITRQSLVSFIYSRTPRFTEAACGVNYIFDIKKIDCTGNLIDSVVCPAGFIDNKNTVNLKVYMNNNF